MDVVFVTRDTGIRLVAIIGTASTPCRSPPRTHHHHAPAEEPKPRYRPAKIGRGYDSTRSLSRSNPVPGLFLSGPRRQRDLSSYPSADSFNKLKWRVGKARTVTRVEHMSKSCPIIQSNKEAMHYFVLRPGGGCYSLLCTKLSLPISHVSTPTRPVFQSFVCIHPHKVQATCNHKLLLCQFIHSPPPRSSSSRTGCPPESR